MRNNYKQQTQTQHNKKKYIEIKINKDEWNEVTF